MISATPFFPITKTENERQDGSHCRVEEPMGPASNNAGVEVLPGRTLSRRNNGCARLLISDDAPVFRDGLRNLVESQPDMCVAGESAVCDEIMALARELKPDLLLLGLGSPERSGLEELNSLASLYPPVRVLVLVSAVEERSILEAFYRGAHGIVLRGSPREVFLNSIRSVIAGQYWLEGESVPILIEALRKPPAPQKGAAPAKDFGLTPHELKIVQKIANASSNKEMGQELSISERTVKHHLTNIFNKLGISSRIELAVFALKNGLTSQGDPSGKDHWRRPVAPNRREVLAGDAVARKFSE